MTDDEKNLREMLQLEQQRHDGAASKFDTLFAAAEQQVQLRRRARYAGFAAAATVAAVALSLLPLEDEQMIYVDVDELTATTQWVAPSDALLPTHQFDIYREIPRLFESTEPGEGAL